MPKEAAPEARPAAMEASIPRKKEESNAASEGCNTMPSVMFRARSRGGSTAAEGVAVGSATTLSEASVAGDAALGASDVGVAVGVAGFSDWALVLRRSIGEVTARVMAEHRPG